MMKEKLRLLLDCLLVVLIIVLVVVVVQVSDYCVEPQNLDCIGNDCASTALPPPS